MLLFSLRYADPKLKKSTLDTFLIIIQERPILFADNVSSIIPQLLKLTKHEPGNDARVRQAALKILGLLTKAVEYSIIAPHKPHVLKALGLALGDHKRVVRKEAANTRGKWSLLIGPASN
jgi:DNA repair/transcription protein MET18/MMS19